MAEKHWHVQANGVNINIMTVHTDFGTFNWVNRAWVRGYWVNRAWVRGYWVNAIDLKVHVVLLTAT